jgi:hypothetical protein
MMMARDSLHIGGHIFFPRTTVRSLARWLRGLSNQGRAELRILVEKDKRKYADTEEDGAPPVKPSPVLAIDDVA